jgi:hypothetical protein
MTLQEWMDKRYITKQIDSKLGISYLQICMTANPPTTGIGDKQALINGLTDIKNLCEDNLRVVSDL